PRNRVVSLNQQTELEVRVRNNGVTDLKEVRIDFYLNGKADLINTVQIPTLPANQVRSHTVNVTFTDAEEAGVFDDLKKQINDQRRTVNRPDMTAEEERVWKAMTR